MLAEVVQEQAFAAEVVLEAVAVRVNPGPRQSVDTSTSSNGRSL